MAFQRQEIYSSSSSLPDSELQNRMERVNEALRREQTGTFPSKAFCQTAEDEAGSPTRLPRQIPKEQFWSHVRDGR